MEKPTLEALLDALVDWLRTNGLYMGFWVEPTISGLRYTVQITRSPEYDREDFLALESGPDYREVLEVTWEKAMDKVLDELEEERSYGSGEDCSNG